jgi:hypothetical protein
MTRVGPTRRSTWRGATGWALRTAILAVTLAACGPSATATPTAATPSVVASPSVAPSTTGTAAPTATVAPTPTPTVAPASPSPTPTATPTATPAAFACTDLPYVRRSGSLSVRVADVRVGQHPGYDRIVYEFRAGKLPAIDIRVAQPPFKLDPSDLPVTIGGVSFIRIKLTHVAVETVPSGADDLKPGYPLLVELRQIAGYEGDATWIAGLAEPGCVRVSILRAPSRLVIDVRSATP